MGKEPKQTPSEVVLLFFLCFLTFQWGYWLFACVPESQQNNTDSFSFLTERAPPCLIGVPEILAGTVLEMYVALCLGSFQRIFHNPDNNLLFTIRCSSNFLNAQAIIFFGN